ncbi:hypothetical protein MRX96_013854 [Rhipicephalus microplus]
MKGFAQLHQTDLRERRETRHLSGLLLSAQRGWTRISHGSTAPGQVEVFKPSNESQLMTYADALRLTVPSAVTPPDYLFTTGFSSPPCLVIHFAMKPRWMLLALLAAWCATGTMGARRPLRKVSLTSPSAPSGGNTGKKIVCYFTNWAQYRQGDGKFLPEDIDPTLCTHIIYAFGWMKKHKLSSFDANDDTKNGKKGLYERVIDLKKKNPNLKVLLAVGGWSFGTQRFKEMASNSYNRRLFIFSALNFLRRRKFDGLDLDWEFPRGNEDKKNFVELVKELREAFEAESKEKKLPRLLLTAAVSAGAETIRGGYDVPAVAAYVDFLNVMSYDFHGKWESMTGHNSPLYASSNETTWRKQLCMDFGVKTWERLGAPKEKIVVEGDAGEFTKEAGFLAYYEICDMLKKGADYVWDDEQLVPYAYLGNQWVGFDDERSIRAKMNWIKANGYAGAMVWTVDMDDFRGLSRGPKNVLPIVKKPRTIAAKSTDATPAPEGIKRIDNPKAVQSTLPVKDEAPEPDTNARVVCYFTNWSAKRKGKGHYEPEDIDPTLCTHVIYAFANIKEYKIVSTEPLDEGTGGAQKGFWERIVALKAKNPLLKVMLAVGGWMLGSAPFREVTENSYRQSLFVFNAIDFLREKGFDGLDVDWEFPRGADDKKRLAGLIKELRVAFDGEALASKKPRLILSMAAPASFEAISAGYDVEELNKHVDMINMMTYDFHGDWERQDYSAGEWVRKGASKEKLLVGIPTYGRTFTLGDNNLTDIGAPSVAGGKPGNYTGETGFLSFFEICDLLRSGATLVWDNEQMVPYAYKEDQWVGFDDQRSLKLKVQWLKQAGYGGVMVWSVDLDDFKGSCTGQSYPLLTAIKEELKGYKVANLEVASSNVFNSYGQLVDPDEVVCDEEDGHISYHLDKKDCTMYYMSFATGPENVDDCKHVSKKSS